MLAQITGNYLLLVNKTISDSVFNDTFLCINIIIGLAMIIIGLLHSRKTMSIKDKFLFIVENKKKLFIIGLTMLLAISALNMLLFILGLGITVDTSSVTLFLYTFFPKIITIRWILMIIICSITKELRLDNVSLSLSSLIFMMVLGSVNYYYVLPYFKVIMFLGLTKLDNLFSHIYLADDSAMKATSNQSLTEGIYNIITKFPIIGRFFNSFRSYDYNYSISSPFRSSYDGVIKNYTTIYPFTKISKFTRIDLFTIIENKVEIFYEDNIHSLKALLKNDSLYLRNLISHFVYSYSNLTCKIKLTCADQMVKINTTFKNGHLEEFYLNRTNLNFVNEVDKKADGNLNFLNSLLNTQCSKDLLDLSPKNTNSFDLCPKNIDSFYEPSADRTRELLHLTDPMNNCNDLQVFMQKGSRNYDYSIQQGESSRHPLHQSNSNRGTKRSLEDENVYSDQNTNISTKYPCLDIRMIELQNKYYLFLGFDPEKLDSERDSYLDEICIIGRSVLLEHYSKWIEDPSAVSRLVDGVGFNDLSISDKINGGYVKLHEAFYKKNLDIINSHGVEPNNIHPFSKLYLEGNLDYPEDDYSEDDYSGDGDNLYNSNLDDSDHSDNYVSLGDSTQKGQEVSKCFESEEIHSLITKLRDKQAYFLSNTRGPNSVRCTLKDIGLIHLNGAFLFNEGEYPEEEITNMFNLLIKVKPDLFYNLTYGHDIIKISVNSICSMLKKLTENSVNDLTEENLTFLTRELKSRIHNFFQDRGFNLDLVRTCEFREIHIKNLRGVIVERNNFLENEFTKLLKILLEKKPEFFTKRGTKVNLPKTSLTNLYCKISDLIRKPLTKDQIAFLIHGLESRKNNLLEYRKSIGNSYEFCVVSDFFFIRNSIILEKYALSVDYQFTNLLENVLKQKPHLFPKKADIDLIIMNLT